MKNIFRLFDQKLNHPTDIAGDNEWNDCPNFEDGKKYWKSEFNEFEQQQQWKNLSSKFNVFHPPNRMENFRFEHKGILFIGLNIVGGTVQNKTEWKERLSENFRWVSFIIQNYQKAMIKAKKGGRIVVFGHANPTSNHDEFFVPFRMFVQSQLKNSIPILYIHGDKHQWIYEPNYLGQKSMLRISLVGQAKEPPLKVVVTLSSTTKTDDVFTFDRQT
jgi:hypothetical protein